MKLKYIFFMFIMIFIIYFSIAPRTVEKAIEEVIDSEVILNNYNKLTIIIHGPEIYHTGKEVNITDKDKIKKILTYFNRIKIGRSLAKEFDATGKKSYLLIFDGSNSELVINTYDYKHLNISSGNKSRTYYTLYDEINPEYIDNCIDLENIE